MRTVDALTPVVSRASLRHGWVFGCLCFFLASAVLGEPPSSRQLSEVALDAAHEALPLLRDVLAIPNDAHFPQHIENNLAWSERVFRERGFALERLQTRGAPLLLATRPASTSGERSRRRLLVYLQLDGQPVDASRWHQDDPWEPVLKERGGDGDWLQIPWRRAEAGALDPEWRVFARSASDAKGPVVMLLAALDQIEKRDWDIHYDLAVIMDFEEELGSPHLPAAVTEHRDKLVADGFAILDGPRHTSNQPTLAFGARGIATVTLTVYGPRVPQHSGHYGNWVPNPALRLAQLIASMKDDSGRVSIPGWYDGVEIDDDTRRILAEIPDDESALKRSIGFRTPDAVASTYQEALQYPSLNVRGLSSGWVGDSARTIIPSEAVAEIDVRLVPESDAEHLLDLLRRHIEAQGYTLTEGAPSDRERASFERLASFDAEISYRAFRTPYDSPFGQFLTSSMVRAFGSDPVLVRIMGGSIPISPFVEALGVPAVSVPTVNPDNNQHSPNENLRLGNFVDGIRTVLALLTEPWSG